MERKKELNDRVTFRANHQEWENFKDRCNKYNLPASVVMRQFIQEFDRLIEIKDMFGGQK